MTINEFIIIIILMSVFKVETEATISIKLNSLQLEASCVSSVVLNMTKET